MKLTKSQREVLKRLASGGWVMDKAGPHLLGAIMLGPGKAESRVAIKTVTFLLDNSLIRNSFGNISDYIITDKGREALTARPEPAERE